MHTRQRAASYEAWIIYNFTSLLLAYVGGPGAVVVKAEGKVVHPSWGHLTCCLPAMQVGAAATRGLLAGLPASVSGCTGWFLSSCNLAQLQTPPRPHPTPCTPPPLRNPPPQVDGFFLRRCKQGTLQFVLLKPVMAALTLILYAANAYTDGDMSPRNGYFYISILYNVCYTFALYGLMLFWIGASELLAPFNPLLKFVLVKTVVFLTFWQVRRARARASVRV